MKTPANRAASIRARLLNHAKADNTDFSLVLIRYALERMLFRLSQSAYQDQFLLKGALLFDLWFDVPHRATRDADMLGFGASDVKTLAKIFQEICRIPFDDGIVFDPDTVKSEEIRKEANYAGVRVTFMGYVDGARCPIQVDVGFGDAVTPDPEEAIYPVILDDLPAPRLHVYPKYTVVAEKFEALVTLGIANSRLKDYFDLWVLSQYSAFSGAVLLKAIQATFERRKTPLPKRTPLGLSDEFSDDAGKQFQWQAFLRKNKLQAGELSTVISGISGFLLPLIESNTASYKDAALYWPARGPWGREQDGSRNTSHV